MGADEGHESRYLIPFDDYVLGLVTEVRDSGVHLPDQVLVPVHAVLVFGNHVMDENVRCHELVGDLWIVLVPTSSYNLRMTALFSSDIASPLSPGDSSWVAPVVTMAANTKAVKVASFREFICSVARRISLVGSPIQGIPDRSKGHLSVLCRS
jgi:hypothetical protein